jgi:ketosteroid isomerase-like protein
MADMDALIAAIAAGFEGDADAAAAAFTEDATFRDTAGAEELEGRAEILEYFLAFGGRRERFMLREVMADGDRAALSFVVAFRADAHAYGQRTMAMLTLREGRIARWDGVWAETDEDLSAWGGD